MTTVAIAVPFDAELVERIRRCGVEVLHEPDLLPEPRFPGDHRGVAHFGRSPEGERRWERMLARAEVLLGFPGDAPAQLAAVVRCRRNIRWVQAMNAGAGEQVRAAGLTAAELDRVVITSAAGVHAVPLAEFSLFGLLAFTKDLPRLLEDQRARRWGHYPNAELGGRTLLVLGLGRIGEEVARLASAFGMRVVGVNRRGASESPHVAEVHGTDRLVELLPRADALVVSLPLTEETRGLIGAAEIATMKPGAILVNVGRGGVIDEPALVHALRQRHLAGAALDVVATEPLPEDSPLWELPNVLLTPHTMALSHRENERIAELFLDNLRRYRSGEPLRNRIHPELLY